MNSVRLVRKWYLCCVAGICWGLLLSGRLPAQELAYVRSVPSPGSAITGAQGNAWLFNRGGECYALTPKHVLLNRLQGRDDRYAEIVVIRAGRPPIQAQGDRCAVLRNRDLTVMHVTGVPTISDCGHVLVGVPNIDSLLGSTSGASLLTASESGRFERSTLEIRAAAAKDPDHFWVAPAAARDRLTEGMSGGLVLIQDQLAGFLLSVETASDGPAAGMAKVLRADRAAVLVSRILQGSGMADDVDGSCASAAVQPASPLVSPAKTTVREGSVNRAAIACGAQVSGWSVPPTSSAFRPENLVGAGGPDGRWRASFAGEFTVDVRLCATEQATLTRVSFHTDGCAAGDNIDLDVEALVRAQSTTQFVSLGFGGVPQAGLADIAVGAPLLGNELRLRFVPKKPASGAVCLGALSVN